MILYHILLMFITRYGDEKIMVEQDEIVKVEIDWDKIYLLPSNIKVIKYKDVFLVIYTEGILWIVLKNQEELDVFNAVREKKNIKYLFKNFSEESVSNVIVQIEAKKFDNPITIEEDEKNVYIYLTNNCNERCRHCYMYAGDINIEEVEPHKWIDVLNRLKQIGCEGVTFTGGEITVYKDFDKIIKHAHDIGLLVTVLSNGILWNDELIEQLHSYIDEIQISIDGYDATSYYEVRMYNGFDKALHCIEVFSKTQTKVSMAVTPLYENLDVFVEKFERFALSFIEKNPDVFIKLNHELIIGREVEMTEEENREYKMKLKELVERLYPDYYTETFVINYEKKAIRRNCGFGGVSISANGDVYWCNRIHELSSCVNVFDADIQTIFKLGERIKKSTSVDNTMECKYCEIKYICGGGCRMKYEGIKAADIHEGEWRYKCEGKEHIYEKMVLSNDYFFEE